MIISTTNKIDCIKAFITTWLKDPAVYCNNCGLPYDGSDVPCCENPQIGTNFDHTYAVIQQNKEAKKDNLHSTGMSEGKNMRIAVSLPPRLLRDLEQYFAENYQEPLFANAKELHAFMKAFPGLTRCDRI